MGYNEAKVAWRQISSLQETEFPADPGDADKLDKLAQKFRALAAKFECALEGPTSGIEAFFETVGKGVVDAQKTLDDRTVEYLATGPAFPTAFRIPKVNAEIQFSALERSGGGFFARIFSGSEDQEKSTKHKVAFDIVAAPPPPELIQQLNLAWMSAFVVTDLPTRRRVRKAAQRFRDLQQGDAKKNLRERAARLCDQFNRTVIVQGGTGYAVLFFHQNASDKTVLEILRLGDLEADDPTQVQNYMVDTDAAPYPPGGPKIEALYDALAGAIGVQEARLNQLDPPPPPTPGPGP